MKKKIILILIIIAIIISGCIYLFFYLNDHSGGFEGYSSNKGQCYVTEVKGHYRLIDFSISIDNTRCSNEIKYSLINPKGDIMLSGNVKGGNMQVIKKKTFKNVNSAWTIKIEKKEEEENARYTVDRIYTLHNI